MGVCWQSQRTGGLPTDVELKEQGNVEGLTRIRVGHRYTGNLSLSVIKRHNEPISRQRA